MSGHVRKPSIERSKRFIGTASARSMSCNEVTSRRAANIAVSGVGADGTAAAVEGTSRCWSPSHARCRSTTTANASSDRPHWAVLAVKDGRPATRVWAQRVSLNLYPVVNSRSALFASRR